MSKNTLIIVDMVYDFMDKYGTLFCGEKARQIIPFIQKRLNDFRNKGDMVIYLQDTHLVNDKEFDRFPKHCIAGTQGNQIIPELKPQSGEIIIQKQRFSGFFKTNLDKILKDNNVESVELVGVCTSICVMDTASGLADRDYSITIPKEGVADFDQEFHDFALKRMKQVYGATIL
ncbi:nicotinamidase/pyrazinamidase [Candidatus Magnetomoraceae bacterium gMMP-15]